MKEYIKPTYETEGIETVDIVMTSLRNDGEGTVGNVTGEKGIFEAYFDEIF